MSFREIASFGVICGILGTISAGCGSSDQPELGAVSGTVTLDGKPLGGVIIVFKPEIGRSSAGVTDAEGKYSSLEYLHDVPGAKIGPNKVTFEYEIGATGPAIPAKYTGTDGYEIEVKAGSNTINFELDSK